MKTSVQTIALLSACVCLLSGCAASISGKVTAVPDQAPVSSVRVVATGAGAEYEATTSSHGRFKFKEIAPGSYRLVIDGPGFVTSDPFPVTVRARHRSRGEYPLKRLATLTGVVRGPDSIPVNGADVFLADGSNSSGTDQAGHYMLSGIMPGTVEVYAVSKTMAVGPIALELAPGPNTLDLTVERVDAQVKTLPSGREKDPPRGAQAPLLGDGSQ